MGEITHDRMKKPWLYPTFLFNLLGRGKECGRTLKVPYVDHGLAGSPSLLSYKHLCMIENHTPSINCSSNGWHVNHVASRGKGVGEVLKAPKSHAGVGGGG